MILGDDIFNGKYKDYNYQLWLGFLFCFFFFVPNRPVKSRLKYNSIDGVQTNGD